jgi:hypothetical protein
MRRVKLYELAHARAGDKGEITNISLFPYDDAHHDLLAQQVTAERVAVAFAEVVSGEVVRYDVPGVRGFNFVLHGTRPGGVAAALHLDTHGKALSFALLELEIELEAPPRPDGDTP